MHGGPIKQAEHHDAGVIQQHLIQLGSGPAGSAASCPLSGNTGVLDEEGMQVTDLSLAIKCLIDTLHEEGPAVLSEGAVCFNMSGNDGTAVLVIPQLVQGNGPLGFRSNPVRVDDPDARGVHLATEPLTGTGLDGLIVPQGDQRGGTFPNRREAPLGAAGEERSRGKISSVLTAVSDSGCNNPCHNQSSNHNRRSKQRCNILRQTGNSLDEAGGSKPQSEEQHQGAQAAHHAVPLCQLIRLNIIRTPCPPVLSVISSTLGGDDSIRNKGDNQ